jgi:hypothetical protein
MSEVLPIGFIASLNQNVVPLVRADDADLPIAHHVNVHAVPIVGKGQ